MRGCRRANAPLHRAGLQGACRRGTATCGRGRAAPWSNQGSQRVRAACMVANGAMPAGQWVNRHHAPLPRNATANHRGAVDRRRNRTRCRSAIRSSVAAPWHGVSWPNTSINETPPSPEAARHHCQRQMVGNARTMGHEPRVGAFHVVLDLRQPRDRAHRPQSARRSVSARRREGSISNMTAEMQADNGARLRAAGARPTRSAASPGRPTCLIHAGPCNSGAHLPHASCRRTGAGVHG